MGVSIKWSAQWIGPFAVKKILHNDVHVLDMDKRVRKNWHLIFHVSLLREFHRNKKWVHL